MATRTFCDHCGNTVRNPKVLSFGDLRSKLRDQIAEQASMRQAFDELRTGGFGSIPARQPAQGLGQQDKHNVKIVDVDLCDTCVPIWLERVGKLCKASDPEEKDV